MSDMEKALARIAELERRVAVLTQQQAALSESVLTLVDALRDTFKDIVKVRTGGDPQ